jgi:hypothetical protein
MIAGKTHNLSFQTVSKRRVMETSLMTKTYRIEYSRPIMIFGKMQCKSKKSQVSSKMKMKAALETLKKEIKLHM